MRVIIARMLQFNYHTAVSVQYEQQSKREREREIEKKIQMEFSRDSYQREKERETEKREERWRDGEMLTETQSAHLVVNSNNTACD